MADGMTDDDRRILRARAADGNLPARALLAEAARTTALEAKVDEALTLLADWLVGDAWSVEDPSLAAALRGLVKNAGGGEAAAAPEADASAERPVPAPSGSPAPQRWECADGVTRVESGEVRPPKKGEWFVMSHSLCPFRAQFDFDAGQGRRILRPVQDPAPRCLCPAPGYSWSSVVECPQHGPIVPDHLAFAAAEARAREAEAEVARLRDGIEHEAASLYAYGHVPLARASSRRLRALLEQPGATS